MDTKIIYSLVLSVLLFGCGTKKESKEKEGIPVVIVINNAMPHCGGAAPMPDDVWPKIANYAGCTLLVLQVNKDGSRGKRVASFETNDGGRADLKLPEGKYQLWAPNKLEPFDTFVDLEKETDGTHYSYADEACFKEWYDRADFEFEVGEKTNFEFVYKNRCFTGAHPCMIYSGPLPP